MNSVNCANGYDAVVAAQRSAALDDLLSRWHHWRMGYGYGRGYNGAAAGTGDYQTSRQYDDANGALDDAIEDGVMKQVDFEISELAPSYQLLLQVQARAVYLGVTVWSSPRLPQDRGKLAQLAVAARQALITSLLAAGVME